MTNKKIKEPSKETKLKMIKHFKKHALPKIVIEEQDKKRK